MGFESLRVYQQHSPELPNNAVQGFFFVQDLTLIVRLVQNCELHRFYFLFSGFCLVPNTERI